MESVIRKSEERGAADFGWLDSKHTFSFGGYYDPQHMGFGPLRVINEDRVTPGGGFPTHPHRDMEIISYVVEGGLAHRDSTGTSSVIRPGDVQRMSAGTGVRHSEYNSSETEPVHFLQIWILPERAGSRAGLRAEDVCRRGEARKTPPRRLAGRARRARSSFIRTSISTRPCSSPARPCRIEWPRAAWRWVQVVDGGLTVNGQRLRAGDGLAVSGADELRLEALAGAHALVFDMAP